MFRTRAKVALKKDLPLLKKVLGEYKANENTLKESLEEALSLIPASKNHETRLSFTELRAKNAFKNLEVIREALKSPNADKKATFDQLFADTNISAPNLYCEKGEFKNYIKEASDVFFKEGGPESQGHYGEGNGKTVLTPLLEAENYLDLDPVLKKHLFYPAGVNATFLKGLFLLKMGNPLLSLSYLEMGFEVLNKMEPTVKGEDLKNYLNKLKNNIELARAYSYAKLGEKAFANQYAGAEKEALKCITSIPPQGVIENYVKSLDPKHPANSTTLQALSFNFEPIQKFVAKNQNQLNSFIPQMIPVVDFSSLPKNEPSQGEFEMQLEKISLGNLVDCASLRSQWFPYFGNLELIPQDSLRTLAFEASSQTDRLFNVSQFKSSEGFSFLKEQWKQNADNPKRRGVVLDLFDNAESNATSTSGLFKLEDEDFDKVRDWLPAIIDLLKSKDSQEAAVRFFKSFRDQDNRRAHETCKPALLKAIINAGTNLPKDMEFLENALIAFGSLYQPSKELLNQIPLDVVRKVLRGKNEKAIRTACYLLLILGDENGNINSAIPELKSLLKDREFGFNAAQALRRAGPSGISALEESLSSKEEVEKVSALTQFGDRSLAKKHITKLRELLLKDKSQRVRELAATGIFYSDREGILAAMPELIQSIKEDVNPVKLEAIKAVFAVEEDGFPALDALAQSLTNPDRDVRLLAAESIWRIGKYKDAKKAIPDLTKALSDTELKVVFHAADSLSMMGKDASSALPKLKETVKKVQKIQGFPSWKSDAIQSLEAAIKAIEAAK